MFSSHTKRGEECFDEAIIAALEPPHKEPLREEISFTTKIKK
jgi:hypothetical protein